MHLITSLGLAALKKCYPILIDSLPSNHLTSLVRLQDVAIIPEAIVDVTVASSSAEIGNKMIINYLIGLIHSEEHIITFCYFAERMIAEFDKCICVLNLKNGKICTCILWSDWCGTFYLHLAVLMNIQVSTNATNDSIFGEGVMVCNSIEPVSALITVTLDENKSAIPNDKLEAKYAVSAVKLCRTLLNFCNNT